MKKLINYSFILLVVTMLSTKGYSQDFREALNYMQANTPQVTIKEETIEQKFEVNTAECIYKIIVNNTSDAEETAFEFNAADLNEYKISFKTGRREVFVNAETKGSKDLIRVYENDVVDGYDDKLFFYAKDVENARALVENFRVIAKQCGELQENIGFVLGGSPSINSSLDYLKQNIHKVSINEIAIDQVFTFDNQYEALMKIEATNETEGETTVYELNAADLNHTTVEFDTHNEYVYVTAQTKGERDLIKVFENGELDDYEKSFRIYVDNIEEARRLVEVFKFYIQEAEKLKSSELVELSNASRLSDINVFISRHVNDVVVGTENYKQNYSFKPEKAYLSTINVEDVNEGEVTVYDVNLADLNENALSFDTKGNKAYVKLVSAGDRKLIMVHENGEIENYENDIVFHANGIEEARYIVEGIKKAVTLSKEIQEKDFIKGNSSPSKAQTISFLADIIKEVVIGEDAYKQKFSTDAENDCLVNFEVTDVSDDEVVLYKFNMKDINVHKVSFDTKGNEVFVELETIGDNDLIELIEEGVTEGFKEKIYIRATDIEEARKIEMALEHLTNLCSENN